MSLPGNSASSALLHLARVAREAAEVALAAEAETWAGRVGEGVCNVAVLGQFKRGKSTLVNALVGADALPTGVVPVTSVVTCVRHTPTPRARARRGGLWHDVAVTDLVKLVAESENPGNRLGIEAVEVGVPSPLLAGGLCLVDTPGIGSVSAANTATTLDFLPHIDAAIFVVGADPPITGAECDLLMGAGIADVVVVLNKADRVPDADRAAARAFTERVLAERLGRTVPVMEVSAVERRAGSGAPREWGRLVETLHGWRDAGRPALVRASGARGLRMLRARLIAVLDERQAALDRPLAESEARIRALRTAVLAAEESIADLAARLGAEQERYGRALSQQARRFLDATLPAAEAELQVAVDTAPARVWDVARDAARRIAHARIEAWEAEFVPAAERAYADAMRRFTGMADGFLAQLRSAEPTLSALAGVPEESTFRVPSRFYVHALRELEPVGFNLPGRARAAASQAGAAYLRTLLESNATLLVEDLDGRMLESRRRLEGELRRRLGEAVSTADRALTDARTRLAEGGDAVAGERTRIDGWRREIAEIDPT